MGGIFGVCSRSDCVTDLFFGTDYHSHLGNRRGGMAVYDGKQYARAIHNIENAPFRTKFEADIAAMSGFVGIGCISDSNPQPLIVRSRLGTIALVTVGRINNKEALAAELIAEGNTTFSEMSDGVVNDTELVAALICRRDSIPDGITYAQSRIEGSLTLLISAEGGLYAARDRWGRTPLFIGKKEGDEGGTCVSFESFAYINLGYTSLRELGPGEVVFITADSMTTIAKPLDTMKMCTFLWVYYGFPTSDYEKVNVEEMRYRCGAKLAEQDAAEGMRADVDYVAGIPDSGTPCAIGYANRAQTPFARPLVKYTPTWPRSFTPQERSLQNLIARMKLVPINALIRDKKLLFTDDSIVRGTQMRGLMDTLFACGAKELHARIGCPPVLFGCKYLNFTRSSSKNETIAGRAIQRLEGSDTPSEPRLASYAQHGSEPYRAMVEQIRQDLNFTSLAYLSLDDLLASVGIERCKLCTYCWNGIE